jgi:hypothetical protein
MGAPDSPVRHRTGTVPCPVCRHVTQSLGFGAGRSLKALSSCGTGQSGAPLTSCFDFYRDTVHLSESTVGPKEPLRRVIGLGLILSPHLAFVTPGFRR